jgi:hypothetical protein
VQIALPAMPVLTRFSSCEGTSRNDTTPPPTCPTAPVLPSPRADVAASSGACLNSIRLSHDPHEGHFPAHLVNVSPHSRQAKTGEPEDAFAPDFEGLRMGER